MLYTVCKSLRTISSVLSVFTGCWQQVFAVSTSRVCPETAQLMFEWYVQVRSVPLTHIQVHPVSTDDQSRLGPTVDCG